MSIIVIEFIILDGIVSDPDGSAGTRAGGWAFRHGPATVAGDKFQLGLRTKPECCTTIGWDSAQQYAAAIEADPAANHYTPLFTSHG